MNYIKITECDVMNGPGVGVVLWVSGCRCKCEGCYNQEAWDFCSGQKFTKEVKEKLVNLFKEKPYYTRFTLSGGHPFEPENEQECAELCREIRQQCPNVEIWAYSGFYWEEIKNSPLAAVVDVVVDGPFIAHLYDETLEWRGSSNQSIIKVKEKKDGN